jgi:heat shock transcription factor, other eukaryote
MTTNLPPFLKKLFSLVNDASWGELIRWEDNGQNFIILDPTEFSRKILPAYFKHKNFSSFVRQLNQYGFSKLSHDEWIFGHKNFRFGQKEQLTGIIRKKKSKLDNLYPSLGESDNFIRKLETDVEFLKKSRQSFSKNFIELCSRQEEFLLQQQNLDLCQKKFGDELKALASEVCQLKSFIFGYLSKIIGKEELESSSLNLSPENEPSKEPNDRKKKDYLFLCQKITDKEKLFYYK